ncbi:Kiwa anti-phage protein KwaB-like domain-containing protein [Ochrobactrum soli]|uniref:DUF4868 domain-containing protein n=1 Tax=Ochrobactrum soli TaxID=2448455 RepID=A0A849KKV4_9HYPH|nr:Kiwa anti-phage protein KwaB-like domain-containing protein [[Ochrobactrum] soli]NNU62271.1 DUF4868 domain-containing protein [[Ochrobactrum] soli]
MTLIQEMKNFNIEEASTTLWTFKKQSQKDAPPQFNGHWVDTTAEMETELKNIVKQQLAQITEEQAYSLLAQNNEGSVLTITEAETHVGFVKDQFANELPRRKVRNVTTLLNCVFYVIKLVYDGNVLYAAKKTDNTWKSKTAKNVITAIFSDTQLELTADENFRIQKNVDFFGFNDNLAVRHKANFESILNYKAAHEQDYAEMQVAADFMKVFDDLAPLTAFIGSNKIHLRRMSAIRQKAFYADTTFMDNLRKYHKQYGLNIQFDGEGRIVPTEETCRDIIAALLDHRLSSAFSGNIYDVPDATQV